MKDTSNIRNFGFIAHIDAGKTTTTERVLYVTGANYRIGEVDDGTTTTDWMEEEKERGITIQAAAVSCNWQNYILHVIDTPGHVDFTVEVQRSLKVLDGAVVVLCGVSGVQTQTETVWKQANNFFVPRIIFINKLDRVGADFANVLEDVKNKLNTIPLLINIPYYEEETLKGVIDLLSMKRILFKNDANFDKEEAIPDNYKQISDKYRENLIDVLTQFDDKLLELVLEQKATIEDIIHSIREGTIKMKFSPIFCGASFKNIGVPLLLDGIVNFLPSPVDIKDIEALLVKDNSPINIYSISDDFPVLYVFKVQYHKEKGNLAFARIYTGKIKNGDTFFNPRTKKKEKCQDLLKVYADSFERIEYAESGDIIIIVGTKETFTGDTLCSEGKQVALEHLSFPEPVIYVKIEPKNSIDLEKFNIAKNHLLLEDPTIRCDEDKDTGQTLVGGMGELHIEIFLERIRREYKVALNTGNPQVAYRETPKRQLDYTFEFDKKISGNIQHCVIKLGITPLERDKGVEIKFDISKKDLTKEDLLSIENGIKNALISGPEGAYPVIDCKITVIDLNFDKNRISSLGFEAASNISTSYLLREAGCILLEPIMKVEIDVPDNFTGNVIGDLQSRSGIVIDLIKKIKEDKIIAKCPLKKMFGYSTTLRSQTQGKGTFTMQFLEFDSI